MHALSNARSRILSKKIAAASVLLMIPRDQHMHESAFQRTQMEG